MCTHTHTRVGAPGAQLMPAYMLAYLALEASAQGTSQPTFACSLAPITDGLLLLRHRSSISHATSSSDWHGASTCAAECSRHHSMRAQQRRGSCTEEVSQEAMLPHEPLRRSDGTEVNLGTLLHLISNRRAPSTDAGRRGKMWSVHSRNMYMQHDAPPKPLQDSA